jgi:hypothetical protein
MTDAQRKIVEEIISKAWDDGFEHCRGAAALICRAHGRADLADLINRIPLKVAKRLVLALSGESKVRV